MAVLAYLNVVWYQKTSELPLWLSWQSVSLVNWRSRVRFAVGASIFCHFWTFGWSFLCRMYFFDFLTDRMYWVLCAGTAISFWQCTLSLHDLLVVLQQVKHHILSATTYISITRHIMNKGHLFMLQHTLLYYQSLLLATGDIHQKEARHCRSRSSHNTWFTHSNTSISLVPLHHYFCIHIYC